jgi:hypothetical protein
MARKTRKEVVKEEEKEKDEEATEQQQQQQQPSPGSGEKIPRKKRRLTARRDGVDSTVGVKVAADVVEVQPSKKKARRSPKTITPQSIDLPAADDKVVVEGDAMKRITKSEEALVRKRKETLLEGARKDAKINFGIYRKQVLDRVPKDYIKMFGQVGFAKWAKGALLPALIMSPFDVPTGDGSARAEWLKKFHKVSALVLVRNHSARSS